MYHPAFSLQFSQFYPQVLLIVKKKKKLYILLQHCLQKEKIICQRLLRTNKENLVFIKHLLASHLLIPTLMTRAQCLSLFSLLEQDTIHWVTNNQQKFISHSSGAWKSEVSVVRMGPSSVDFSYILMWQKGLGSSIEFLL